MSNYKLQITNYTLRLVSWLANHGIDDRQEAYQSHGRSHYDTTSTEDVGIECALIRTSATHQEETENDNRHAHSQQYEVDLIKR